MELLKLEQEDIIPRICPEGCGETVIATNPTVQELELLKYQHPHGRHFFHIKCSKCMHQCFMIDYTGAFE